MPKARFVSTAPNWGGVITTATLRDATRWDALVTELGQPGLVRHGLRHTALTWMADAGIDLHILQRVAGHQDPAVTARRLHPDVQAMLDVDRRMHESQVEEDLLGRLGRITEQCGRRDRVPVGHYRRRLGQSGRRRRR